jgi:hypothetical protein
LFPLHRSTQIGKVGSQMKTMNVVLLALFLASFGQAKQTWIKTYGGATSEEGNSVQQTSDGGYIIAGGTEPSYAAGSGDVYLVKTNASGDTLWTRTYGGKGDDRGNAVQQTVDGGYIVAGYTESFGHDVYLVKTNAAGDTLWTRTYGGTGIDAGRAVQQTKDGGYLVAGQSDVYLVRTNASGDTLWTRTYGGKGYDFGYAVQQTSDRGCVIAGYTTSFGAGDNDVYLIGTNPSGGTLWTRTYGGPERDEGYSVQQTKDGGYVITGSTRPLEPDYPNAYLIKTDANGTAGTK